MNAATTIGQFESVTEVPGTGASREQIDMLRTRYEVAASLVKDREVLEVACGPGLGLGYLARHAARVVGGDCDEAQIGLARNYYQNRIELHHLDAQALPFQDESFDAVLLLEAIYYLPQAEKFVAEARRVLRSGGLVYVCSANREWTLFNPSPFSRRYYAANELRELLQSGGFQPEILAGFPDAGESWKSRLFRVVRKAAVKLRLIPQTMNGKEKLKRLLFGKLDRLPQELTDSIGSVQPLVSIMVDQSARSHKVIYAIGRLAE